MTTPNLKTDIYTRVTEQILADLDQGIRPWLQPWKSGNGPAMLYPLRHTGVPYRGINCLMLWGAAMRGGYRAPFWMTYRQAQALGGHVRKGEAGHLVVYANSITRTETDAEGETHERDIPFLKGYTVFNVEQCEGLPEHYTRTPEPESRSLDDRLETAGRFFANTGARVLHGGDRAFYLEGGDYIGMPPFKSFTDAESYAATLAHELIHWTKHPNRLDRSFGLARFGNENYAKEELVAELGSAFLCAHLAITPDVRPDHAAYIGHWLQALRHDKRLIFTAASYAQRAVDYLQGLQPQHQTEEAA